MARYACLGCLYSSAWYLVTMSHLRTFQATLYKRLLSQTLLLFEEKKS